MVEVVLDGLAPHVEEATIQTWFYEEGDPVSQGDDLLELSTSAGSVMIQASASGIVAEVYYDEGDTVAKGDVLCTIDNEVDLTKEDEEAEEEEDEEKEDE